MYRRVRQEFPNVGVCLQAYLYRTVTDLRSLIPLGGGVRLVKGAYREPPDVAMPKKSEPMRSSTTSIDARHTARNGATTRYQQ